MKKGQIFDLAYEFRNSKLWKQIYEEELFAVKLPHDIAYCNIMGRNGDHMALKGYANRFHRNRRPRYDTGAGFYHD